MIDPESRLDLETSVQNFIRSKRWFSSKGRAIIGVEVEYFVPFHESYHLSIFRFHYADGGSERYFVPFTLMECGDSFISARIAGQVRNLYDATGDPGFVLSLLDIISGSEEIKLPGIVIRGEMNKFATIPAGIERKTRKITAEQSNTSIVIGNMLILKIYRKLIDSDNPDIIIPTMLWQNTDFRNLPMPVGKVELAGQNRILLASLSQYLSGSIDGWSRFVTNLSEGIKSNRSTERLLLLEDAEKLGSLTGRMHMALRSLPTGENHVFSDDMSESMLSGIMENIDDIGHVFSSDSSELTDEMHLMLEELLSRKEQILHSCKKETRKFLGQSLMVVHGDFHLGQVLFSDGSYYAIDFEGEPMRRSGSSFIYSLPYKDIAGMIRSFDYSLAFSSRSEGISLPEENRQDWLDRMTDRYLSSYSSHYQGRIERNLLRVFLTEKSIYELKYELNNRPAWVDIPLEFLSRLEFTR